MSMRLRFVLRPVLPLLVVTGLTGLAACSKSEPPQAAAAQAAAPVPTVGVVKVKLGQVAVAAELPGRLEAARSADVRGDYLALTRANLLTQAFKFLGERYGWGHAYGTRDCSGFVSEVYRSFGVEMPRNSRDQGLTTAFDRIAFTQDDDHAARVAVLRTLDVGDLVFIPGHVMMVIGQEDDETWLIHDTSGMRYRNADGTLVSVRLNQVAVTPLLALLTDSGTPYVDLIYSIQRIRRVDSP